MERTDGVSLSCVLDQMEQMSWCQITQPQATISQRLRVVVFVHSLACCIEELKRNHITWFFSLNAPPHILSCAQIPRCSVIHSVLLICSLLCQDLADVHIFGNCTATWCLIFSGGNESVTSTKVTTARSICYLACLMMYPGCFVFGLWSFLSSRWCRFCRLATRRCSMAHWPSAALLCLMYSLHSFLSLLWTVLTKWMTLEVVMLYDRLHDLYAQT